MAIVTNNESWSVSETVITMPCHGVITGSNPVQTAKGINKEINNKNFGENLNVGNSCTNVYRLRSSILDTT